VAKTITTFHIAYNSFNEWCRGLTCVAKNDCGHVEHGNLAWITAFINYYTVI